MATCDLILNGKAFSRWKTMRVVRSIDNNCGVFMFSSSSKEKLKNYPVREGDSVKILINGQTVITGYVDTVSGTRDTATHELSISGRDNIQDLIDSDVPDTAKVQAGPISLGSLCKRVISSLGLDIPVKTAANISISDFTSKDLQAASSGDTCMGYLVGLARKRQVYLCSDGDGGLNIFRPDRSEGLYDLPPVLSASFERSMERRFYSYKCVSQDNFGYDIDSDYSSGAGCHRSGTAIDSAVRKTRYCEIQAEKSMSDQECSNRAAEECNIRRSQSIIYDCIVQGVTRDDGKIYNYGQFFTLKDDYAGISGVFLAKTVEYNIDCQSGSTTRLELVLPDAYQAVAARTKSDQRKSSVS